MSTTRAILALVTVVALGACSPRRTINILFRNSANQDVTTTVTSFTVSYYRASSCACAPTAALCGDPIGSITFMNGERGRIADATPDGDLRLFVTGPKLCASCNTAPDVSGEVDVTFVLESSGAFTQKCP